MFETLQRGKEERGTGKQGERYVQTGRKVRSNWDGEAFKLVATARPHKSGRAPLYVGAVGQIQVLFHGMFPTATLIVDRLYNSAYHY